MECFYLVPTYRPYRVVFRFECIRMSACQLSTLSSAIHTGSTDTSFLHFRRWPLYSLAGSDCVIIEMASVCVAAAREMRGTAACATLHTPTRPAPAVNGRER